MTGFFRTAVLLCLACLACGAAQASQCRVADGKHVVMSTGFADKFELAMHDCSGSERPPAPPHESEQLRMYDAAARPALQAAPDIGQRVTGATAGATAKSGARLAPGKTMGGVAARRGAAMAPSARAIELVPSVRQVAASYDIDPLLLHAIAHVESRHNVDAVSPAGARGVMQVMPATARRFGVRNPATDLHDPRLNLEVSSAYLKTLQGYYGNNLPLVLAAYNAGEGAVAKYGQRIPPYRETQAYVRDVMAHYAALKQAVARP